MEQAPFIVGQCVFTENIIKEIEEYKLLLTKVNYHFFSFFNLNDVYFSYAQRMQRTKIFITCH